MFAQNKKCSAFYECDRFEEKIKSYAIQIISLENGKIERPDFGSFIDGSIQTKSFEIKY